MQPYAQWYSMISITAFDDYRDEHMHSRILELKKA
jgi:hypothetical protein